MGDGKGRQGRHAAPVFKVGCERGNVKTASGEDELW